MITDNDTCLNRFVESMRTIPCNALLWCFCSQNVHINLIQRRWRVTLCMGKRESRTIRFSSKVPGYIFQEQVLWDFITQEHGTLPGWQSSLKTFLGLTSLFFWSLDVTIFYSLHSSLIHSCSSVFLFLIWPCASCISVIIKISEI